VDLRPNKFAGDILVKAETASTPLMKSTPSDRSVGGRHFGMASCSGKTCNYVQDPWEPWECELLGYVLMDVIHQKVAKTDLR